PVSWTILNAGDASASGWVDRLYMSTDATPSGDDVQLGAFTFEGTLGGGQSVNRAVNIELPLTTSGNFFFYVVTDSNHTVYEHFNENNNTGITAGTTNIKLRPFPNLVVTDITEPTGAASSQPTEITWQVTNTGTGPTSAGVWYDAVYLSTDTVFDG